MGSITEIHENIYNFLEEYKEEHKLKGFFNTFRKINKDNRLEKGYWFHGNENYLAISFWGGNDWKNKTPNIFFCVNVNGETSLEITAKDSILKANYFNKNFITQLGLVPNGKERWRKFYNKSDYIESLNDFIVNDKLEIDFLIKNIFDKSSSSEDKNNSIKFIAPKDYNVWLNNVKKYRENNFYKDMPFALTEINIFNFGLVKGATFGKISKNTPFIFLVGENGGGKSTILKAIATAVGNKFFSDYFITNNPSWLINFSLNQSGKRSVFKINAEDSISEEAKLIPFAAYGASRLLLNNDFTPNSEYLIKTKGLYSLFYNDGLLIDFNRSLVNELENSKTNIDNNQKIRRRYENIKQILITIIPDLYDIRESNFEDTLIPQLLYFEEDYNGEKIEKGVSFNLLASGIKSLVALIGDMVVRLFQQQPEIIDPSELSGIVIIDEIDIHLHPKLQKEIPKILSENFPKIQFIVSTHSPIPLLGAPKNSKIYNIYKDYNLGVKIKSLNYLNISNLLPNTILTSPIFGMEDLVSVNNTNEGEINVDDNMKDTDFFDLLDKKMDELNKREKFLSNKYFS